MFPVLHEVVHVFGSIGLPVCDLDEVIIQIINYIPKSGPIATLEKGYGHVPLLGIFTGTGSMFSSEILRTYAHILFNHIDRYYLRVVEFIYGLFYNIS